MSRPRLWPPLAVLGFIHALVLGAGFFAPYDPTAQDRAHSFAPPVRPRLVDAAGKLHARPFVYARAPQLDGSYRAETARPFPLRFLVPPPPPLPGAPGGAPRRLLGVEAPARLHLLGTDRYGRDLFSRLLYGGRISLCAGLFAAATAVFLGLACGALAGFYGGVIDTLLMRGGELLLALPWLYLLIAARAALPLDLPPARAFLLLVGLIALVGWVRTARLVRGVVRSGRERDFVHAARGFGASDFHLLHRHLLPQTLPLALSQLVLLIPRYILAEVTLSFLGLGVAEPIPSWGTLLATLQRYPLLVSYPWLLAPVPALVIVILSYHLLANALAARLGLTPS